jgi:uncharacterized protein
LIFIDSGAFLARHVERDQHHVQACLAWDLLAGENERCFTSNFVLDETFTLLGRRTSYAFAAAQARSLYTSRVLEILRPTPEDEIRALERFEKLADQKVSFTDCISFVLMRREGLQRVFSFDRHFIHAGFRTWPDYGYVHEPPPVWEV